MKNSFIIGLALTLFFTACNNSADQNDNKKDTATNKSDETEGLSSAKPPVSGTFDQLFVDTIKFNSVSKVDTMFFTLVVRSGQLSYRVWPFENGKFKKKFSFALKNGPAVSLNTSKEIHFGNVELDSGEVQKIINTTRTQQAKYVIFKPYLTTESEIADSIFVSKDTAIRKVVLYQALLV